ncbi:S-Ena type endospore appendage [Longirhabdus pacifica]|uniref:S-Ena type endospore appendage n=1 Tax=Longirhabdus pacifica TaxID=2305227 RepID=UPI001008A64A|nr:S-Ena type endospore appendage [Longirhabdus pacifica]
MIRKKKKAILCDHIETELSATIPEDTTSAIYESLSKIGKTGMISIFNDEAFTLHITLVFADDTVSKPIILNPFLTRTLRFNNVKEVRVTNPATNVTATVTYEICIFFHRYALCDINELKLVKPAVSSETTLFKSTLPEGSHGLVSLMPTSGNVEVTFILFSGEVNRTVLDELTKTFSFKDVQEIRIASTSGTEITVEYSMCVLLTEEYAKT